MKKKAGKIGRIQKINEPTCKTNIFFREGVRIILKDFAMEAAKKKKKNKRKEKKTGEMKKIPREHGMQPSVYFFVVENTHISILNNLAPIFKKVTPWYLM